MRFLATVAVLCAVVQADQKESRRVVRDALGSGNVAAVLAHLGGEHGRQVALNPNYVRDVLVHANDAIVGLQDAPPAKSLELAERLMDLADSARTRWPRNPIAQWAVEESRVFRQRVLLLQGKGDSMKLFEAARALSVPSRRSPSMTEVHLRAIELHFATAHYPDANWYMAIGNIVYLHTFMKNLGSPREATEIGQATIDLETAWSHLRAQKPDVEKARGLAQGALEQLRDRIEADTAPFHAVRRYNDLALLMQRKPELGPAPEFQLVPHRPEGGPIFSVPLSREWRVLEGSDGLTVWQQDLDGRPRRAFKIRSFAWKKKHPVAGRKALVKGEDPKGIARAMLTRDKETVRTRKKSRGPTKMDLSATIQGTLGY
jgi:hypothetical protein